ncbi:hypothetical protein EDC01DRAFT_647585 [Geopyxis carbonaria]|nr:hypothetical protein EDC01DRAFT_647585 [Geopyxis carbonaria]
MRPYTPYTVLQLAALLLSSSPVSGRFVPRAEVPETTTDANAPSTAPVDPRLTVVTNTAGESATFVPTTVTEYTDLTTTTTITTTNATGGEIVLGLFAGGVGWLLLPGGAPLVPPPTEAPTPPEEPEEPDDTPKCDSVKPKCNDGSCQAAEGAEVCSTTAKKDCPCEKEPEKPQCPKERPVCGAKDCGADAKRKGFCDAIDDCRCCPSGGAEWQDRLCNGQDAQWKCVGPADEAGGSYKGCDITIKLGDELQMRSDGRAAEVFDQSSYDDALRMLEKMRPGFWESKKNQPWSKKGYKMSCHDDKAQVMTKAQGIRHAREFCEQVTGQKMKLKGDETISFEYSNHEISIDTQMVLSAKLYREDSCKKEPAEATLDDYAGCVHGLRSAIESCGGDTDNAKVGGVYVSKCTAWEVRGDGEHSYFGAAVCPDFTKGTPVTAGPARLAKRQGNRFLNSGASAEESGNDFGVTRDKAEADITDFCNSNNGKAIEGDGLKGSYLRAKGDGVFNQLSVTPIDGCARKTTNGLNAHVCKTALLNVVTDKCDTTTVEKKRGGKTEIDCVLYAMEVVSDNLLTCGLYPYPQAERQARIDRDFAKTLITDFCTDPDTKLDPEMWYGDQPGFSQDAPWVGGGVKDGKVVRMWMGYMDRCIRRHHTLVEPVKQDGGAECMSALNRIVDDCRSDEDMLKNGGTVTVMGCMYYDIFATTT